MDNGSDDGVIIPVASSSLAFKSDYESFLADLKNRIQTARVSISLQANASLICLYWQIGNSILTQQKKHGWGAKVIDKLSHDLKKSFPDMQGFSPRNLKYMRRFAEIWPDLQFVQQVVAQIPWGTNIVLMQRLGSPEERLWYAQKTIEEGWSRNIPNLMIDKNLMERSGQEPNNFSTTLPPADSDMAAQVFKDPYLFDFLGTDPVRREKILEDKLTDHIQEFLLELGRGFAFVGRQVHLEFEDEDYYIDMLFYHLKLRCYIVIELKACKFDPGFLGQLSMYQNVVDAILKEPEDKPTIGILLVMGKNNVVVEYSLDSYKNPIGVADWQQELESSLVGNLADGLPTIEEMENELEKLSETE